MALIKTKVKRRTASKLVVEKVKATTKAKSRSRKKVETAVEQDTDALGEQK